eukprot:TRINITY_DN66972_c2_g5_i1.p1 TRINITY_DN66972_c2_g5~~TRINITY_DN66972_c2_g5_i1.p1  ORF type:complete len:179 (+),score=19.83 TRINITY_DN66972_c2_g5_i1:59-595(+)
MEFIHKMTGIVLLDNEGKRIFAKYWTPELAASQKKQASFEKQLYSKTKVKEIVGYDTDEADITVFDNYTVVYRCNAESYYYMISEKEENEVVLSMALDCFYTSLVTLIGGASDDIDKRALLESFELLVLLTDEMFDDGIIMEINSDCVLTEVKPHARDLSDSPLSSLKTVRSLIKQHL